MNVQDMFQYQNMGLPEDIRRMKEFGDFEGAIRLIDLRIADPDTPEVMRHCLTVHREMIKRLPEEFPYTKAEAIAQIRENIPDFTEAEFDEFLFNRRIRWIYVNGEMRIFLRFYSTLLKTEPDFAKRANAGVSGAESASDKVNILDVIIPQMKQKGALTYRIHARASVKLKDSQFVPGMFMRVHLPIPAKCQQQKDIRIEKIYPENGMIDVEESLQRAVCWEENMTENHEFTVEYSYLHTAEYKDAYHMKGLSSDLTADTQELAPHIVFTPYIKALVAELTQGMTDPMEKARACYDFITKRMKYTYMPGYFVLENIAESCAKNFNGDCGVFALLLITMLRCAGIPAQWQSGLTAEPDFIGCHDWVRFYVEPYGWMFADPSYGISANRQGKEERRQFYFGNLDPFRMVANSVFQQNFTVPKEHWRNDPYDNQSGEMETTDRGFLNKEYVRNQEIISCEEV